MPRRTQVPQRRTFAIVFARAYPLRRTCAVVRGKETHVSEVVREKASKRARMLSCVEGGNALHHEVEAVEGRLLLLLLRPALLG